MTRHELAGNCVALLCASAAYYMYYTQVLNANYRADSRAISTYMLPMTCVASHISLPCKILLSNMKYFFIN